MKNRPRRRSATRRKTARRTARRRPIVAPPPAPRLMPIRDLQRYIALRLRMLTELYTLRANTAPTTQQEAVARQTVTLLSECLTATDNLSAHADASRDGAQ